MHRLVNLAEGALGQVLKGVIVEGWRGSRSAPLEQFELRFHLLLEIIIRKSNKKSQQDGNQGWSSGASPLLRLLIQFVDFETALSHDHPERADGAARGSLAGPAGAQRASFVEGFCHVQDQSVRFQFDLIT